MPGRESHFDDGERLAFALAMVSLFIGLVVRFNGLGNWPLSVDEYYLTKSVLSIFDDGLPDFQCGGFYVRGVLQQYVSALAVAGIDNAELAMRLYPLAFNLGAIWVTFLLGRRIGGNVVGYMVLSLMAMSLWEIEFARFARMYAPFQFFAVLQVLLLTRVVLDNALGSFKWMLVVGLVALLTYEAGVFLAAPVLIALLRIPSLRKPVYLLLAGCLIVLAAAEMAIPFRSLGVAQPGLPADILTAMSAQRQGLLALPDATHIALLFDRPAWLIGFGAIAAVCGWWLVKQISGAVWFVILGAVVCVISIMMSFLAFGIAVYFCVLLTLMDRESRTQANRLFPTLVLPVAIVAATFWIAFAAIDGGVSFDQLVRASLKFPNALDPLLYPYWEAVPVLVIALAAPIALYVMAGLARRERFDDAFLLVLGVTLVFLIGVALVVPNSFQTRYSFFVYPLLLCLFAYSVAKLSAMIMRPGWSSIMVPVAVIAIFAATEDFDIDHYLGIDTATVNYRVGYTPALQEHFKSRNDYRTTADFVNARVKANDRVVIGESTSDFYLDRVDFRFKEMSGVDFANHISCGLGSDVWSNAPILYREAQIEETAKTTDGELWVIKRPDRELDQFDQFMVFEGEDGRMQVLRIPAGSFNGSGDGG